MKCPKLPVLPIVVSMGCVGSKGSVMYLPKSKMLGTVNFTSGGCARSVGSLTETIVSTSLKNDPGHSFDGHCDFSVPFTAIMGNFDMSTTRHHIVHIN